MRNETAVRDRLNATRKEFDRVDRNIRARDAICDREYADMIEARAVLQTEIRILRWVLEDETARRR